jgi:signal transduction histidine kinase
MTAIENEVSRVTAECRRLAEALSLAQRDLQLLGFEIHDGVVQDLTAAAMLLEGAARQATFASPEGKQSYEGGVRLLQDSIAAARQLIQGATTVAVDGGGIVPALDRLVEKFRADHGLPVTLTCDVEDLELPGSVEHLLLRIAQESLSNVWKYAWATEVEVRLGIREEKLELVVSDNGVGFDPDRIPPGHFGLEGITARASILGADVLFDTAPHHGTRIVVRLTPPTV